VVINYPRKLHQNVKHTLLLIGDLLKEICNILIYNLTSNWNNNSVNIKQIYFGWSEPADQSGFSRESFWNANPLLLSNLVLVDVNIISKSIKVATEHKWSVHERAWVHELSFFSDLHFFDIEYEAAIEDQESESTFTTKDQDFIISNLIC